MTGNNWGFTPRKGNLPGSWGRYISIFFLPLILFFFIAFIDSKKTPRPLLATKWEARPCKIEITNLSPKHRKTDILS